MVVVVVVRNRAVLTLIHNLEIIYISWNSSKHPLYLQAKYSVLDSKIQIQQCMVFSEPTRRNHNHLSGSHGLSPALDVLLIMGFKGQESQRYIPSTI